MNNLRTPEFWKLEEKTARDAILESPEKVKKIAEDKIRFIRRDYKLIYVFYEFKKSGLSGKEFIAKHKDWFSRENDDIMLELGDLKLEKYRHLKSQQPFLRETIQSQRIKELEQEIKKYQEKIDAVQSQLEEKQLQINSSIKELLQSKSECHGLKEENRELREKNLKTKSSLQEYINDTKPKLHQLKQNEEKIAEMEQRIKMYNQTIQENTEIHNAIFEARRKRDIEYESEMNTPSSENHAENEEKATAALTPNKKPKK